MKKQKRRFILYDKKLNIKHAAPIAVIIALLAGVLGMLAVNTAHMYATLRQSTVDYANNLSAQLADGISYRLQTHELYIRSLADTFSRMPEFLLTEELLERKAEYLEMDDIFVVDREGTTIPAGKEHAGLGEYLSSHMELFEKTGIFFAEHGEVFFSAPIVHESGADSLLIGVHSNITLQQMLQNVDFKNQGLCCIVDKDGVVVVSATDEAPFIQLNDLFGQDVNDRDAAEAQRLLADIGAHRSGVAEFSDVGGESILLGYDFLGINDWMLLTLVTANLFSEDIAPYLFRYIWVIAFLFFVILAILFAVAWYYRNILRHIQNIALTDPLTGGHNELAFRLESEKQIREHPEKKYAIVYLNIRDFKGVNERFGVEQGDELLRQVCRILRNSLLDGELISRNAGDHFYLLMECPGKEALQERLQEQLAKKFSFARFKFDQGAYWIKERDDNFVILSNRAKVASGYPRIKDECRFYDDELRAQIEHEQKLNASFQHALEHREFQLYIQPKVSPDKRAVCGGEVLVRWQHPEFGLLFPNAFIPLFERNGKICELNIYVFEETCRLLNSWKEKGKGMMLSVNLSRAHLISNDLSFLDVFGRIKEQYGVRDGQIELELTESLMLERRDVYMLTDMIDRARKQGFLCSIDDFGFGYSSLTMLKDMNATTVKLDRQFFMDENEKSWIVVEQLIRLIHNLGMTVVAEGIEQEEQVEKLRMYGCDLIQGYVCGKPMPAADFACWTGV